LVRIGEEVTRKLARKAQQFFIIEMIRPKYASRKNPDQGILAAPLPDSIIERCPADGSLLASVPTAKYCDHLPLYRQVQMLQRSDVRISRQTLSKRVLSLGVGLAPLYEAKKCRVLQSGVVFVDESPISLQTPGKGPCKKAYMWVYAGGDGEDPPYRFFVFRTSRSHAHVEQTLKDYRGVLHSDKYAAYEKLARREDIRWCPCMAHVRRKFVEAEGGDSEHRRRIRPLTIGRKNWMFVGSENGGQAGATILSLVQTWRNLDINPQVYMEDVLRRIMNYPAWRIEELLPDLWLVARQNNAASQMVPQDGLS